MDTRAAREIANRNNPPRLIRVGDPTREIRARGEKFDISPFGEREREREGTQIRRRRLTLDSPYPFFRSIIRFRER